jgi:putative transposase
MIDKLRHTHPVDKLCQLVDVAKSGYQAWRRGNVIPARRLEDKRLLAAIKAAHERSRGTYGPAKIRTELASQGISAGLNRIKRLRKLNGIRCTHKKKFRVTTDSKHQLPVAENLLNRQFRPTAPNRVWVADITYIPTDEGWLFLAAIKDLYTCEIVGWAMDKQMTKQLVIDALRAAYWRKKPKAGLMHHSDRGSQYCSAAYRALQVSYGMTTSMSRRGNCWDNAPMESFFGTLKTESLHHYRFATREEARRVVFEYIEVFYNQIRRHAKINNQSPADCAKQFNEAQMQLAA